MRASFSMAFSSARTRPRIMNRSAGKTCALVPFAVRAVVVMAMYTGPPGSVVATLYARLVMRATLSAYLASKEILVN